MSSKVFKLNAKSILLLLAIALPLSIFSWFRLAGFSADFDQYYIIFIDKIGIVEPFWELIRSLIYFNNNSLILLYALVAFFSLLLKLPILIHTKMAMIAIPVYLLAFFMLHEYTQIRISLALAVSYLVLGNSSMHIKKWKMIAIYAAPSLFHFSLVPLIFLPYTGRFYPLLTIFGFVCLIFICFDTYFLPTIDYMISKLGDNTSFDILNILSAYFFFVHIIYFKFFRRSQSIVARRFHDAALIYVVISIPFGIFQYGTAYFRFLEISASLLLPAIFYSLASRHLIEKLFYGVIFCVYYLAFSYKVFRDLI